MTDPDAYESLYFAYEHYPFAVPPEMVGKEIVHPVVIVGAGPVGLTLALALVRQHIRVVVLEDETTVNRGSRAAGTSRRSLEILGVLGAGEPFARKGLSWCDGWSYYRDRPVLEFSMPQSDNAQYPPMVNIQQCFVEQYILDQLVQNPLAEIRWGSKVEGVRHTPDGAVLDVVTPQGGYELNTDWVVACDGARSAVRTALGLKLYGSSYETRYVIADVQMESDLSPGRRVWFDSSCYPGSTVILHRQPDNIWRLDYQLQPHDDADVETRPETVRRRVTHFLEKVGIDSPWELDWVSLYRAHSRSLENYRHGHVLFAGDSAHLVPIFGARGMNSGIDDAFNLAWKLAYVIRGRSDIRLLDTYSEERRFAYEENIRNANKSATVMSPATRGDQIMRDAVLSLALTQPFVRPLLNPRQSSEIVLDASSLNGPDECPSGVAEFVGSVCPNVPLREGQYLHQFLGMGFTLIVRHGKDSDGVIAAFSGEPDVKVLRLTDGSDTGADCLPDETGAVARSLGIEPGGAVLLRPDHHVAGRWLAPTASAISQCLFAMVGVPFGEVAQ